MSSDGQGNRTFNIPVRSSALPSLSYQFPGGAVIRQTEDSHGMSQRSEPAGLPSSAGLDLANVIAVNDLGFTFAASNQPPTPMFDPAHEPFMTAAQICNKFKWKATPKPTIRETIDDQIHHCLDGRSKNNQQFLPIEEFESIFNHEIIWSVLADELPGSSRAELGKLFADIVGDKNTPSRRRILAILICMDKSERIRQCIKENIYDIDFPLTRSSEANAPLCFTRTSPDKVNNTLLEGWARSEIMLLYDFQKYFFVPFFQFEQGRVFFYELSDTTTLLPWHDLGPRKKSGRSSVRRVEINSSHHNFKPTQPTQVRYKNT